MWFGSIGVFSTLQTFLNIAEGVAIHYACGARGHYYPEQRHSKFMLTVRSLVLSSSSIPSTVSGKTYSITSIPLEGDAFVFLFQEVLAVTGNRGSDSQVLDSVHGDSKKSCGEIGSKEILCFS